MSTGAHSPRLEVGLERCALSLPLEASDGRREDLVFVFRGDEALASGLALGDTWISRPRPVCWEGEVLYRSNLGLVGTPRAEGGGGGVATDTGGTLVTAVFALGVVCGREILLMFSLE